MRILIDIILMYRMTRVFFSLSLNNSCNRHPLKKCIYIHTLVFDSIKMHTPFLKCHVHVILLKCAPSARFKIEQSIEQHSCITWCSSFVSTELTLHVIRMILLYSSYSVIETSVTTGITQNKYNSTIQRKHCSKYDQPGLIKV